MESLKKRLSLVHYDVVRELCASCRYERFHFVPIGAAPAAGLCPRCGADAKIADVSDTSVFRLIMQPGGEMVIVPLVAM